MARIGNGFNIAKLKKDVEDYWIRKMRNDCIRLVSAAYTTKTFQEETGNLADSIGAAVYRNGVLLEDTIAYREPRASSPAAWYPKKGDYRSGHEEMIKYFRNYKPRTKGLTIVLVAAMPYAEVLEQRPSKSGLQRKYKVITGAYSSLRQLKGEYEQDVARMGYKTAKYGQGIRVTLKTNE
jgi:hypothetical protein